MYAPISVSRRRLPGGRERLTVEGELTSLTASAFCQQVLALLAAGSRLELDLTDLEFIDLRGLRALDAVQSAAAPDQVTIIAACATLDLLMRVTHTPQLLSYRPPGGTAPR